MILTTGHGMDILRFFENRLNDAPSKVHRPANQLLLHPVHEFVDTAA